MKKKLKKRYNQQKRKDLPLKTLRKVVCKVYEENGYKILNWFEGAYPKDIEKIQKEAPSDFIVLDLALDALAKAYGRVPRRNDETDTRDSKNPKRIVFPAKQASKLNFKVSFR